MRSRLVGGLALAVVLAALTACGGEEEPGAEKQRYIEQSDAICRQTFEDTSGVTGRDQQAAEKLSQEWAEAAEQLRALPRPGEDFETATQFVVDVENLSMSYTAAARALVLNDQEKADRAFDDVTMIRQRAANTAEEYGYVDCAQIRQAS